MARSYGLGLVLVLLAVACRPTNGNPDAGSAAGSSSSSSGGVDGGRSSSSSSSGATSTRSSSRAGSSGSTSSGGAACPVNGRECTMADGYYGQCCSGQCIPYADPQNCYACNNVCPANELCAGGGCVSATCGTGSDYCQAGDGGINNCCGAACVNTQTSTAHCGACFSPCGANEACVDGNCYVADCAVAGTTGAVCAMGNLNGTCCGDACVNTYTNAEHCGACGAQCPDGTTCSSGTQCVDPTGTATGCRPDAGSCGAQDTCVGFDRCLTNSCTPEQQGFQCARAGEDRTPGNCCDSACIDTMTSQDHCGQCNTACNPGEYCHYGNCTPRPTCNATNNGLACPTGPGTEGVCCNSSCVDTRTTAEHCGTCGASCPSGGSCTNAQCQTADGGYAYCRNSTECPSGLTCAGGRCSPEACGQGVTGVACAFGGGFNGFVGSAGTCCGGECVDPHQDGDHCGGCDRPCPNGGLCAGDFFSQCIPTSAGTQCSNGNGCFGSNLICANGYCVSAGCMGPGNMCATGSGVGVCCSTFFSFTCVDLVNDTQNCGGCGAKCDMGQQCVNGACVGVQAPCGPENLGRFCGPTTDGGSRPTCCAGGCKNMADDPANCGTCGHACNTGESCVNGGCAFVGCSARPNGSTCWDGTAFGDCCAEMCVDNQTDEANCGQCGRRCAANAVCEQGRCGVTTCTPEVAGSVCFEGAAVGRCCGTECVDTSSDTRHCSGCGLACNAGEMCVNAGCQ